MKSIDLKFVLAAATLACCGTAPAGTTLVTEVRVFDGERMQENRSVLIDGNRIADADFHGQAPAGTHRVSGAGRTLLPGLIDAHVHAYSNFGLPLLFGVTTQVDMFTGVQHMQEVTARMQRGENQQQPDLFSAGTLATAPGGHGTEYGMPIPTLTRADQAQAFVDARLAEGSHFIKIVLEPGFPGRPMATLDLPAVRALIEAAHRRGKLAVVHISNLADARSALEAGADGLVHLFVGAVLPEADVASLVQLAKARHAFIIPTFSVLESVAGVRADDILGDPALMALLDKDQVRPLRTSYGQSPKPALLAAPNAVVAALRRAGVPILAGTDAGNAGTQYGISLHHELGALVHAGLTPVEALAAATSAPATAFGLGQRGRIANGYKADLVLVEGNPGTDISATRHIVEIWKDGSTVSGLRARQQERVAQELKAGSPPSLPLPPDGRISLFSEGKMDSPVGLGWMASNDGMMGGKSTVALKVLAAAPGGTAPLDITARVAPGFPFPWAGVAFMPGKQPMQPANLSAASLLKFRVRGDGKRYQVMMMGSGSAIPVSVGFTAADGWKEVSIPFGDFKGIDASVITMIAFNAGPDIGDYHFQIADVRLVKE